ncbi:hypothetical protein HDU92_005875 [Lobulomyces angularis]|nr:hypothetical protein HDU92_005875 [Lobulomyces angularis]
MLGFQKKSLNLLKLSVEKTETGLMQLNLGDHEVKIRQEPENIPPNQSKLSKLTQIKTNSLESPAENNIFVAIASQEGFKYINNVKHQLHSKMEDFSVPALTMSESCLSFKTSFDNNHVFILADGHGGADAGEFMANRISDLIKIFINNENNVEWNLNLQQDSLKMKLGLEEIFNKVDKEYCEKKILEYTEFKNMLENKDIKESVNKPVDDGCTLIANILINSIHGKWLVNANVGDSRTIVSQLKLKSKTLSSPLSSAHLNLDSTQPQIESITKKKTNLLQKMHRSLSEPILSKNGLNGSNGILFQSVDHNMSHVVKLNFINDNGGKFLSPFANFIDPNLIPNSSSIYSPFQTSRVYRPASDQVKQIGVSHKRTLNLSSTMGDLLFKIEPAVLCSKPDISIVKLDSNEKTLLVAATDGIWDHLRVRDSKSQNEQVFQFLNDEINGFFHSKVYNEDLLEEKFLNLAKKMVIRENSQTKLFDSRFCIRFDDAMVQLILI